MGDRVKMLRKFLKLTQQKFADRLGIKRNTITSYEIGRTEPSLAVIGLICREFHVNEQWLCTGEGEMFEEGSKVGQILDLFGNDRDSFVVSFASLLAKLDVDEWEIILNKMLDMVEAHDKPEEEYDPDDYYEGRKISEMTVEEVDEIYKKARLDALKKERSASNGTEETRMDA